MWPHLLTGWEMLLCRNHSLVAILLIFLEHSIQGELWDQEGGRIWHFLPCSASSLWDPCRACVYMANVDFSLSSFM